MYNDTTSDENLIKKEYESSKKYMFEQISDNYLVKISPDNVARVEAMIRNDSAYIRSSDKGSKPVGDYGGSTAYHMCRLKEVLLHDSEIDEDIYRNLIRDAIKAVDRENSTHLNADTVGIDEITERIVSLDRYALLYYLKYPDCVDGGLIRIISEPTTLNSDDLKHSSRENVSFASKFCHYACFYIYEGTEYQDNYSIYDNVMINALPRYVAHYNLAVRDIKVYSEYRKTVDELIEVTGSKVSRNGLDHLLWYYHKGRD